MLNERDDNSLSATVKHKTPQFRLGAAWQVSMGSARKSLCLNPRKNKSKGHTYNRLWGAKE